MSLWDSEEAKAKGRIDPRIGERVRLHLGRMDSRYLAPPEQRRFVLVERLTENLLIREPVEYRPHRCRPPLCLECGGVLFVRRMTEAEGRGR